jgi:RNA polymerase sigma-70 factor (ECF subfamily)
MWEGYCLNEKLSKIGGETQAFAKELDSNTFESHRKRLFYFILRHVNHHEEAEDLLQETLLQGHRSMAGFQGQSALSTWLTGIALNLVRNHLNRTPEKRYQFINDEAILESLSEGDTTIKAVETQVLYEHFKEDLKTLPEELRETLMLVAVHELSYEHVAEHQQISISNVKNRVFRARKILRKRLLES